jgi:hypothetical protein
MAKSLARSSMVDHDSFPVPAPVLEDMVGEPGQSDTKLSPVGDAMELDTTI